MKSDVQRWLQGGGEVYLKNIGIKRGQIVLDFGCGEGHYAIPAAKVVGRRGLVYAQDKEKKALEEVIKKAKAEGLENIKRLKTEGELKIDLNDGSVDAVLLYDVLHYHHIKERRKIYREVHRILRSGALLSVFPRHHEEEMQLKLEEVKEEIKEANFVFERKLVGTLLHDVSYVKDSVLNFKKK